MIQNQMSSKMKELLDRGCILVDKSYGIIRVRIIKYGGELYYTESNNSNVTEVIGMVAI